MTQACDHVKPGSNEGPSSSDLQNKETLSIHIKYGLNRICLPFLISQDSEMLKSYRARLLQVIETTDNPKDLFNFIKQRAGVFIKNDRIKLKALDMNDFSKIMLHLKERYMQLTVKQNRHKILSSC